MKHTFSYSVMFFCLIVTAFPVSASFWGSNKSDKTQQVPTISSDGEYKTAENEEKQLDEEISQARKAMHAHKQKYKEFNFPVFAKKIDAYVEQCEDPEKPCVFTDVENFVKGFVADFHHNIQKAQTSLKKFNDQKKLLAKAREVYLSEKKTKSKELGYLLDGINRYIAQADRDNEILLLNDAQELAQMPIEPDGSHLVSLAKYQDFISNLQNKYLAHVVTGRLNELLKLYPQDYEIKKIQKQFQDKPMGANHTPTFYIAESANKIYVEKCEILYNKCTKLADSTIDSMKEQFKKEIEENKYYALGLAQLYEQYEERNRSVTQAQELVDDQ